ncbi:alpha/beta fold hydrolase [Geodermatophilus sp. SYSU D00710]
MLTVLTTACNSPQAAAPEQEAARYCSAFDAYELHDCRPQHRLPDGPLGEHLGWLFEQLGGDAARLTAEELAEHLTPELQAVLPPEQLVQALRSALSEVGPARFTGFAHPPREDQALALGETPSGQRVAVAIGVDGGLVDQVAASPAPPTLVPRGRYDGWHVVDGRRLFLRCTGRGSPTVVFDNGLSHFWYDLQQQLSDLTRVCSYDPAGQAGAEGRSDPAPTPRTAEDRVDDLRALLAVAGVPGPYVLAGASNGGLFDLLFASRHPAEVAGLVLIDAVHPATHERTIDLVEPTVPPAERPGLPAALCRLQPPQVDPEQIDICTAEQQTATALADHPLRPVPLSVLSRRPAEYPPGSLDEAREQLWADQQAELAALVPGSHHVVSPTSDHDIALSQPHLVAEEVAAVVEAVRAGRSTTDPEGSGP